MDLEAPWITSAEEQHGHPLLADGDRDHWKHWDEWADSHHTHHQKHRLQFLEILIKPKLEYYYELEPAKLATISVFHVPLPKQPKVLVNADNESEELPHVIFPPRPSETASYDEKHEYLLSTYKATLEVALPGQWETHAATIDVARSAAAQSDPLYGDLWLSSGTPTIRLVEILPAIREDQPVDVRLFTTQLDSCSSQYEALSYTWGSGTVLQPDQPISVNGVTRNITSNLFSALVSLRHHSESRTVWIDSICINQNDLQERADQVLIMAKIYAQARGVVIYLGPSTPASTALFEFLQSPLCHPGNVTVEQFAGYEESVPSPFWKACQLAGPELVEGFLDVCSRTWWNRVWILQEYTCSKQDPIFYCGRQEIPNKAFHANFNRLYAWAQHRKVHYLPLSECDHPACDESLVARHVGEKRNGALKDRNEQHAERGGSVDQQQNQSQWAIPLQQAASKEWATWGYRVCQAEAVMQRRSYCIPWSTPDFLFKSLTAQCSDPHDIVYGVRELIEPVFKDLFKPDYRLPISTLFTRLAAYMIIFDGWTDLFWHFPHRLQSSDASGEIPSWVPDFTRSHLVREGDQRPDRDENVIRRMETDACILDRTLLMDGWLLDEIVSVFALSDDPFRLLQQVWYIERAYARPVYLRLSEKGKRNTSRDQSDRFDDMLERYGGVIRYPSVGWASRHHDDHPTDISIVDIIGQISRFDNVLRPTMDVHWKQIPSVIDRQIKRSSRRNRKTSQPYVERESTHALANKGLHGGAQHIDMEPNREDLTNAMKDRFLELTGYFLKEEWADFIGIATFDYDNLRAQILHRLVMYRREELPIVQGPRDGTCTAGEKLDAQETWDHCQGHSMPVIYDDFIALVEKGCESDTELHLREAFVVNLATGIRRETAGMVGLNRDSSNQTTSIDNHWQEIDPGKECTGCTAVMVPLSMVRIEKGKATCNGRHDKRQEEEDQNEDEIKDAERGGERREEKDEEGEELDNEREQCAERHTGSQMESDSENNDTSENDNNEEDNDEDCATEFIDNARDLDESSEDNDADGDAQVPLNLPHDDPNHPSGAWSHWRRTPTERTQKVDIVFRDLITFLSGREMFLTENGLLGLGDSGTSGLQLGDDILLVEGMSFPILGRLEPHPNLGSPKKRRSQVPTIRMRREILGTAVVKGIDSQRGDMAKVVWPEGFTPRSGVNVGTLRFK